MTKIVCSASNIGVGCTFLDWSINFLSGQTQHLHWQHGWQPLSLNPVTQVNAHGHRKNHPSGLQETQQCVAVLRNHAEFGSLYPSMIHPNDAIQTLGINIDQWQPDTWARVNHYRQQELSSVLHWLADEQSNIVFVSLHESQSLYMLTTRGRDRMFATNKPFESELQKHTVIESVVFRHSVEHWHQLGLTNTWDQRERLALNLRPLEKTGLVIDLDFDHFWIDSRELWYAGKTRIKDIMHWLSLDIDAGRYNQWCKVYDQWQAIQLRALDFSYRYSHIVDAIVNNWSYDIDLSFEQEVVIQHCLIYQHGLNLKTWQLEKFPNNTKLLHALLEPNIHPLHDTAENQ